MFGTAEVLPLDEAADLGFQIQPGFHRVNLEDE
jgi:hypothetical protein